MFLRPAVGSHALLVLLHSPPQQIHLLSHRSAPLLQAVHVLLQSLCSKAVLFLLIACLSAQIGDQTRQISRELH